MSAEAIWSADAERSVLACALMDAASLDVTSALVAPSDFYSRTNARVFAAMLELRTRGEPVDTITVRNRLIDTGRAEAGTDEHLLSLTTTIVMTSGAAAHARIVREKSAQRAEHEAGLRAAVALERGDVAAAREILSAAPTTADPVVSSWVADFGDDPIGEEPPRRSYLARRSDGGVGWMPSGEVCLLVAHGGVGKSMCLAQLALSVASGARLFGCLDVDPGPVAILSLEDDSREVLRRLHWASLAAELDADERRLAASRIRVISPPRDSVLVAPDERGVPREQPIVGELLRDLRAAGVEWRAIILDPLNRLHACDENANGAMGHVVAAIERFKSLPGNPAVIVAHHSAKGAGGAASRGATAIVNGARWCAHLEPQENDPAVVRLEVVKSNYTARGRPIYLTRRASTRGALVHTTIAEECSLS